MCVCVLMVVSGQMIASEMHSCLRTSANTTADAALKSRPVPAAVMLSSATRQQESSANRRTAAARSCAGVEPSMRTIARQAASLPLLQRPAGNKTQSQTE